MINFFGVSVEDDVLVDCIIELLLLYWVDLGWVCFEIIEMVVVCYFL